MSDWIDEDGYRANVGIVLMSREDKVFLGGRPGGRGWQFPQGGIGREESLEAAMYRELREEIGLAPADVACLGATQEWLRYRLPKQYVRRHGAPRCVGQKQRWVLLRFEGQDSQLRFDATSTSFASSQPCASQAGSSAISASPKPAASSAASVISLNSRRSIVAKRSRPGASVVAAWYTNSRGR